MVDGFVEMAASTLEAQVVGNFRTAPGLGRNEGNDPSLGLREFLMRLVMRLVMRLHAWQLWMDGQLHEKIRPGLVGREAGRRRRYRSISPITMSSEPTIAGTSASRQPRQSSLVTERLQKQEERARTRHGIDSPVLMM